MSRRARTPRPRFDEPVPASDDRTEADARARCLRCGYPVADRPRGCKDGGCPNCRHPYPLGDCSD